MRIPLTAEADMRPEILERIQRHEEVWHELSAGGVLSLDRGLPFLVVYREPPEREDHGTARLISAESSYLVARRAEHEEAGALVRDLAETGSTAYGAFLVLEVWSSTDARSGRFTIHAPPEGPAPETVAKLTETLRTITPRPGAEVVVDTGEARQPPGLPPLLTIEESWKHEILLLGLELPPIYRDPDTGEVYPRFLRRLRRDLSRALRQALYEFVRVQTSCKVENHLALGTRTLPEAAWEIDRELCDLERAFDMLLLASPVNEDEAWARFEASGHQRDPEFHYRLLPMDPDLLKRRLFGIEMERLDDPAVADLFQDKREELDTRLTMLGERGTERFRYSSQRLYGTVSDALHATASDLLRKVSTGGRRTGEWIDAEAFGAAAREELAYYAERYPALRTEVQIRPDLTGLMVSRGNLLIGAGLRLDPERVPALIHHEVGTHVLTFVNGSAQPLEQLALGLADYDELQEGLAVLSEYLVGGLNSLRMRLLAARVIAARSVEEGAGFVDTFRLLTDEHGYSAGGAWRITVRVHASGGFTRDFIYLRGLIDLLAHLQKGGDLESLYLGKIAQKHIPVMEELRHRGVLRQPALLPRILEDPTARKRLASVRRGLALTEMVST